MINTDVATMISRFAFVFLVYVIITSGYITEILSCQMRKFLIDSSYARHILAIIMLFGFIMFEGGWDFDKEEEDKAPTNWASGNTLHTLILAFFIYIVFLISSKSKLIPNIMFFTILFIIYCINTYRSYIHDRKRITDKTNQYILLFEKVLVGISIIILIYGFIEYISYQKLEYGDRFSWMKFLLGSRKCTSIID